MSSGIVYEGVEPQYEREGGLFHGISFWVSHRTPARLALVKDIKANGGSIVNQEKDADMLIADPRKPCPPGSYSFTLIQDALKTGLLPDKEKYLSSPPVSANVSKPSASTGHTKSTRTPFTAQDDAELLSWVLPYLHGTKARGNEIYKELAQRNSRHSAQSWRDRYVKRYVDFPEEKLRAIASRHVPHPGAPSPSPQLPPSTPALVTPNVQVCRAPTASEDRQPPQSRLRNAFTEEEDATLLEALRHVPQPNQKWFEAFAQEHPTHASTSWYGRWKKVLKHQVEDGASDQEGRSASPDQGSPAKVSASRIEASDQEPATPEARNIHDASEALPEKAGSAEATGHAASPEDGRDEFFSNLLAFLKTQGKLNDRVDLKPTIAETVVDLYELYHAVDNLETEIEDMKKEDWADVANTIGFDCARTPSAPSKIHKIWTVYLSEFYNSLEEEEDEQPDGEEEEEEAEEEAEEEQEADEEGEEEGSQAENSAIADPPVLSSLGQKRGLEREERREPSKKTRRNPDDEIPSTPDSRIGVPRPGAMSSPSLAAHSATRSLPSRPHFSPESEADEDGEDDQITPSQQLHAEEAETTPIPIQLTSSRHRSNQSGSGRASRGDHGPQDDDDMAGGYEVQVDDDMAALASQCERFEALGYSGTDVKTALRATTFDIGLAGYVMEHYLKKKKKLPTNMEGVWIDRDDDGLRLVDEVQGQGDDGGARQKKRKSEWARLLKKHTQDRIDSRREYLAMAGDFAGR